MCRPKMEALEKIGLYNKNIGIQSVYQNMIANIAWPITIESFHTDNWDCETAPEHGCCSSKGGSKGGHNKWSPDKGWICPPSVVHFWEEKPSLTRLTKNWSERFGGQLSPFHHHLVRNFCAWIETFWDWSWGRRSVPTSFCLQYHDQYFIWFMLQLNLSFLKNQNKKNWLGGDLGRVLPEAKFENKTTLSFEIFLFERPIQRYL